MMKVEDGMLTVNILTLLVNGTRKGASFNISDARVFPSIAYKGGERKTLL